MVWGRGGSRLLPYIPCIPRNTYTNWAKSPNAVYPSKTKKEMM